MTTLNSRQVITQNADAAESVGFKSQHGEQDYMGLKADVNLLYRAVQLLLDNAVFSAYGGMFLSSPPVAFPDIDGTWQTINIFDNNSSGESKNVIINIVNSSISFIKAGVYIITTTSSINHDSSNGGRNTNLRMYNLNSASPASNEFPVGVGRNVEVTTITPTIQVLITEDNINQELVLQIGGGDTLENVEFGGAQFNVFSVGEYRGEL